MIDLVLELVLTVAMFTCFLMLIIAIVVLTISVVGGIGYALILACKQVAIFFASVFVRVVEWGK